MRKVTQHALMGLVVSAALAMIDPQPSEAQSKGPKPWCIADGSGGPGTLDCTYWTFQQCRESASGAGGSCVENPVILWARRDNAQKYRRQDR